MNAARFLFRVSFRARWRAWTAIGLLAGTAAGVVMIAAAGARRTDSAPERVVLDTRAADILVNPNNGSLREDQWRALENRPEVADWARVEGVFMVPLLPNGQPDIRFIESPAGNLVLSNPDGNELHTIDRPGVVSGRIPDRSDTTALVINETAARLHHLHVGSRLPVGFYRVQDIPESPTSKFPKPAGKYTLRVAAIVRPFDDATRASDDPRLNGSFVLSQALSRRIASYGSLYGGLAVVLHDQSQSPAYERAARRIAGSNVLDFQLISGTLERAHRGNRPYVAALWLFAVLAALAGAGVVTQLSTRQQRGESASQPELRALGATRRELVLAAALRALFIGGTAAIVAIVVAWFGSALMPIGPMRILEPHRGMNVDGTVIGWGAGAVLVLIVLLGIAVTLRHWPPVPQRSSRLGDALARTGAPVPTVVGVRMALDPGRGDAAVPVWSTVVGVGLALAALVATFGYAASLTKFTSTPRLYGWIWTAQVEPGQTTSAAQLERAATTLSRRPDVHAAIGGYAQLEIGGKTVGAVAMQPGRGVPVIDVVRGRAPERDDEIALGATTLRNLHTHIGDSLDVGIGSVRQSFRIVGQAVFPRFAPYPASEPTGLGVGGALTLDGLRRFGRLDDSERSPLSATPFIMVDGPRRGLDADVQKVVFGGDPEGGRVLGPQRPNDVASYAHLQRTPLVLVGLLVLLAVTTLVHLLVTAVRRRRKELAMLRALGCTAGQMRRLVLVQATTLIGLALLVAVPIGVIAGRLLWSATARWLGVPVLRVVPGAEIALVVLGAFVVGSIAALVPAIRAGRVDPAEILRSE
jgi:hypothetical protein